MPQIYIEIEKPQVLKDGRLFDAETAINANFTELYSGLGAGSSSLILTSPDGNHWQVGVNDLGALTTEETVTVGVGIITLTSPNATQFTLGVNNAGALTTEEII